MDPDLARTIDEMIAAGAEYRVVQSSNGVPARLVIELPERTTGPREISPLIASQYSRMIEVALRRGRIEHAYRLVLLAQAAEHEKQQDVVGPHTHVSDVFESAIANALEYYGLETLHDLGETTQRDLLAIEQFGHNRVQEVVQTCFRYGIEVRP